MTSYQAAGMISNCPRDTKFYNHKQAKILAQTYYDLGYNLYQSTLPLIRKKDCKTEDTWRLWPAFVNLSFSCEIILKLFYENDNGEMAHGHKFFVDLYDKLSSESKKLISELTINTMKINGAPHYTYDNFEEDLRKSENTFVTERYVFEVVPGKEHFLQCGFLLEFAKTLNILGKGIK